MNDFTPPLSIKSPRLHHIKSINTPWIVHPLAQTRSYPISPSDRVNTNALRAWQTTILSALSGSSCPCLINDMSSLRRSMSSLVNLNTLRRVHARSPQFTPSRSTAPQQQQAPMASPDYHREAEQIVKEEREQREKMPNYPVRCEHCGQNVSYGP